MVFFFMHYDTHQDLNKQCHGMISAFLLQTPNDNLQKLNSNNYIDKKQGANPEDLWRQSLTFKK